MKFIINEKKILNIIKFLPIFFVLIISLTTSEIYLLQREKDLEKEIKVTKQRYLFENKERIKNEIDRIVKYIYFEKEKANRLLKQQIKERVYEAYNIASKIHEKEKNNHSNQEVLDIIKNVLKSITFNNGRGYIFFSHSKENENISKIKGQDEGYETYYWYKPSDTKNTYKKISFYKYFEPYDLTIAAGEYIEDFNNELQKDLLSRVKSIEDKKDGYIFIFDEFGKVLAHHKDSLIGQNRYQIKNPLGKYVVKDIIIFALANKQGYMTYSTGVNPKNLFNREKTSYIKLVDDWNWVIGTGFFLEEFNKEIEEKTKKLLLSEKKAINKIIILTILITLILIIISFYISNRTAKIFLDYKKIIEKENEDKIKNEKLLLQQSKMAAMGEMLGNIAHQWRQPLSAISSAATGSKIQKEMNCLSDAQFNLAMDKINNSAQYLSETIEDFRSFFNPKNNKEQEFEISTIINKALTLVGAQFTSKEIEVKQDIENYKLVSLENELIQVIINILNNARDILILTEGQERFIFIKTYKKNKILYIEILDNAGGIKEDIIDKIFEPYFTTKHKSQGTGIGLYMSEEIIKKHLNGTIIASNHNFTYEGIEYIGAKFTIKIFT